MLVTKWYILFTNQKLHKKKRLIRPNLSIGFNETRQNEMLLSLSLSLSLHIYVFTKPDAHAGCDSSSIFQTEFCRFEIKVFLIVGRLSTPNLKARSILNRF